MDLREPERKELPESVIPMINVVFLLLIFFLISATLTPPVDATPPTSDLNGEPADPAMLVIEKDGAIVFGALRGDAAVVAAAKNYDQTDEDPFALLADADASGAALAKVMRGLSREGVRKIALTTVRGTQPVDCQKGTAVGC